MRYKHTLIGKFVLAAMCAIAFTGIVAGSAEPCFAEVETVTLKNGAVETYGVNDYSTKIRWVTHINGKAIDLSEEPGVSRSYAYCVQPSKDTPDSGTYNVTVIDEDEGGKLAGMRKMIYYLPGAYGYTSTTKSRWFSKKTEGSSDYAIGHITLSYMYDNCSGGSDAWIGTGSAVKSKVKNMIADLDNLPDPPDSFEVFWVKIDGKQDTFGAIYAAEYGLANVVKSSSNPIITSGNSCYSIEGAQYTVFKDAGCTAVAKTKAGDNAVLTIKADGSSDALQLQTGDYYIQETLAPRGYALDTDVHSIQVSRDATTTYTAYDIPKNNPVSLLIEKVDMETGANKPQAAATLKGAEFTVTYYDITPGADTSQTALKNQISGRKPASINGKEARWVFRTDEDGRIYFDKADEYLIRDRSADMYTSSSGNYTFPIGIITVEETKAPRGYNLNEEVFVRAISESGTGETLQTLQTLTGDNAVGDRVYRGDICFSKSAGGQKRMKFVPFRLTSKTTGESHMLITDENGYACTASGWNEHTNNTNKGKSDTDGIWFDGYNDAENGAKPENALAALPYDTYLLEEMRCDSNQGYELINDTVTIRRDSVLIDLGTFDDEIREEPKEYVVPSSDMVVTPAKVEAKRAKAPKTGDSISLLILYIATLILALGEAGLLTVMGKNGRLKAAIKTVSRRT